MWTDFVKPNDNKKFLHANCGRNYNENAVLETIKTYYLLTVQDK